MGLVTVTRRSGTAVMTYANPPFGTMTAAGSQEMLEAFRPLAADREVRAIMITGGLPGIFIRHYDVDELNLMGQTLKDRALPVPAAAPPADGFLALTDAIFAAPKPVIAAINGLCMGGGFEIALACDIILASEAAVFALPEPRVGLAALAGGLHRLPRAIGTKRAMGMILTARRVSAAEGKELGFVHEVTTLGDLMTRAKALAGEICQLCPMSIRASKEAVYHGLDEPSLEAALKGQNKYPAVAALYTSEDFKEGPLAFSQKRAPNWQGR